MQGRGNTNSVVKKTSRDQPLSPASSSIPVNDIELFAQNLVLTSDPSVSLCVDVGDGRLITFRRLCLEDYHRGYINLLSQLTTVGNISEALFSKQFEVLNSNKDCFVIVGQDSGGKVVGSATLLIEHKFIHSCGSVGHVEDVVVDLEHRGRHIGQRLLMILTAVARLAGCYKIMLDCNENNVSFYATVGFECHSNHMALYFH